MSSRTTRRNVLKAAVGAVGAVALRRTARAAAAPRRKPNLLFLWTDEQRPDTMAAYGNTKIHAPNLNRFAQQSVVFANAYDTQPVCTPARSSVMTGLWPHTTGCVHNNIPLPEDVPCVPELLGDADYRTAYMGKWHLGDEIFAQHGFAQWVSIEDVYRKFYRSGRDQNLRSNYHHFLLEHGYQPDAKGAFSRSFATRRPIEHCKPKFLETEACDFLRRHQRDPFMLYVNFLEPHPPYYGPLDNEHDPARVDLPVNFDNRLGDDVPLRYHKKQQETNRKYPTVEKWRSLVAKYWGLVTEVDRSVGAILNTLDALGLADNTIVVFSADHGDMMGSHRMTGKSVMFQEAIRVPWLMRVPQMASAQRIIPDPVSHIDMVPTLLELLGAAPRQKLPGQSLLPLISGGKPAEDHVFIQWNSSHAAKSKKKVVKAASSDDYSGDDSGGESTRAVISPDGWKLCLSDTAPGQLYHLREDPGETKNLLTLPEHRDVVGRLTERIHRWQESVGDKLVVRQA